MSESLTPPASLPEPAAVVWREVVAAHEAVGDETIGRKVGPRMEAFCSVMADMRDATERVARDGLLIQDARGQAIPHPAIEVKNSAVRELGRFGSEFQASPPRQRRR